jgi:surface protein
MFSDATSFNQDISIWDVSNVTDMTAMFSRATSFNQDIGDWDVSNVTDMRYMFGGVGIDGGVGGAASFNQDISSWDVSNVTNMSAMFHFAAAFNQDISSWDVTAVTRCSDFSKSATAWTLPKPNFTNCDCDCLTVPDNVGGRIVYRFQQGDLGYVAGEVHGIVAAEEDIVCSISPCTANQDLFIFGCNGYYSETSYAIGTGASNTQLLLGNSFDGCALNNWHPARLCYNLDLNGYTDWFLPSMDEFNLIYENIGQGNVLELGNFGNFGNNSYLEFFTGRWRCLDTEFSW